MCITAAIGGALALGGSIIGGNSQNKAANKVADTSVQTAAMNNALARDIYGKNEGYLAPYAQSGLQPNALLAGAMGYGDQDAYRGAFKNFLDNSDYAFQMQEGGNAINSNYAGRGVLQSGAAMKGLEDYRSNLQSGFRGEFNSLLANQQALGLGAGSALAGVGGNYVNQVTANNNNAGSAVANAALIKGQNNPIANSLGVIGGGLLNWGLGR